MDKRKTVRAPFLVRAVVKYQDKIVEGEVDNLSVSGIFVKTSETIPVDTPVEVSFFYMAPARIWY